MYKYLTDIKTREDIDEIYCSYENDNECLITPADLRTLLTMWISLNTKNTKKKPNIVLDVHRIYS